MHNKFIVFTDEAHNKTVMTGSMNFTYSCTGLNDNDVLFISDNRLADKYDKQFAYLLGLTTTPQYFERFYIDGVSVEAGFSIPSAKSTYVIDKLVSTAGQSTDTIDFMIFTMTSAPLFACLKERLVEGVAVRGLFDKVQLRSSTEEKLYDTEAVCRYDGNEHIDQSHGGKLHHKCMILDGSTPNATVVTGSFNWTAGADRLNNENILIIKSKTVAAHYTQHFERLWADGKRLY